jgi:pimeloyl-ACP methyl ester carboxylesterase
MQLNTKLRICGRIIMFLLIAITVVLAGVFIVILSTSTGKPTLYHDENGKVLPNSISEKNYIEIKGGKIGFFIKGVNKDNPILLYLHGGMPDYFLTEKYPTGLDKIFTVVWLEQRGAGLSYNARYRNKSIDIDDLIDDTIEITNYLRCRFSQNKIYLMAHSGGSYLGIKVIEKHPELYKAYIGVSQISYQKLSEKMAYDYIVEQYSTTREKRKISSTLLKNPVELMKPLPQYYIKIRDYAMHDLGIGTMRNMKNVITGIFIPTLLFKEYSLNDKINLWKGKASSGISIIWNEMSDHDLAQESNSFKIPVYFLHGIYDYTCSYELAKQYYDKITAPDKGFYSFDNSAHCPIFEEPIECVRVIKENILNKTF